MTSMMGPKVLLIGGPGAGKTFSLATIVEAGYEIGALITDPGGEESLIDGLTFRNCDMNKVHWRYVSAASPSWGTMMEVAKKINMMGYKDLSELKMGIEKNKYRQWFTMLETLSDFECQRCHEHLGQVDDWPPNRVLVIDSFSGVNTMAWTLTVGAKPAAHQGEWGTAMNVLERFIEKLTGDIQCPVVVIAHLERELNEVDGSVQLMTSTIGKKLAPKLPRLFSDVILAHREGSDFYWSTTASNVDLKTRNLPMSHKLEPSFAPILEKWESRVKAASAA